MSDVRGDIRGGIRVVAMVVLPHADGVSHAVSRMAPTRENPAGFHRLVGGGVEPGETARDAAVREVAEELGATLHEPVLLGVLEDVFEVDGQPGHDVVHVHTGRLEPADTVPPGGAMFWDCGRPMPVEWRPVETTGSMIPLYPRGADELVRRAVARLRD